MSKLTYFDGASVKTVANASADASAPDWQWTPLSLRADDRNGPAPRDLYLAVGDIFRCVQIRANAVSRMPRYFYDLKGGAAIEEGDKRLAFLGNFSDTLWRTTASLLFYGASYIAKLDSSTGTMRWMLSQSITPIYDNFNGMTGFMRAAPGQSRFTLDQLAYIWYPSPFSEVGPGVGAAMVAAADAGVVASITRAITSFFDRGMIQPILIYSEDGQQLTDPQRKDLKTWLSRMFSGVGRAFQIEVAARKLGKLDLSSSLKDALPDGLRDEMCKNIAKTMGIPFSMLYSDAANYATAQQDEKNLQTQSVIPDCELIQSTLNRQLFNLFGVELYFAPDELECFRENANVKAQGLGQLISAGVPVDVAMDSMGYDLDEEDEARVRLIALMKEGATYDAARAYILADAPPEEIERVTTILDLFAPKQVPTSPVEQLYNAPQVAPAAQPEPPSPAKADLLRWQAKAIKRLKAGKRAACDFESDYISDTLAGAITGALDAAETVDDVKAAFRQSLLWSQYP